MIEGLFIVLTCSYLTCPALPLWYEILENFAVHGFIGAAIALWPSRVRCADLWTLFTMKEAAFNFPNDPRLLVALDCLADLLAIVSMGADEFRDYILGFIFNKYPSERMHCYANTLLHDDKLTFTTINETPTESRAILDAV